MKRILSSFALVAGLLAVAAPASAATAWQGVVVAKDSQRGTVVIASANGVVRTARSPKAASLKLGQRLAVTGTLLPDGTFKAASVKSSGLAKTARVRAVVVKWQRAQHKLLVSAGGSTFVLTRNAKARTLSSASETGPQPGDQIAATVTLATGTAQATTVTTVGHLGTLEVEGILTKLGAGTIEVIVAKAGFVTFTLPTGFVLPTGLAVFDKISAKVSVGVDGKLTLLELKTDNDNDGDNEENDHDDGDDGDNEDDD
jgi:hypothetical protein